MPNERFRHRTAIVVGLLAAAWLSPSLGATVAKPRKSSAQVRFVDAPSAEKPAEREKRLRRECQGRPNAGACLGYTR